MAAIYRGWKPPRMPSNKPRPLPKKRMNRRPGKPTFHLRFAGGPLDGARISLRLDGGTLPICLGGQSGRYNEDGIWLQA